MIWYRVEDCTYASLDEYGDVYGSHSYLQIRELPVVRTTPKGAWLDMGFGGKKFVLAELRHRGRAYAAPTEEQAVEDFRLRKQFRLNRLQSQINNTKKALAMAELHFGAALPSMHRIEAKRQSAW